MAEQIDRVPPVSNVAHIQLQMDRWMTCVQNQDRHGSKPEWLANTISQCQHLLVEPRKEGVRYRWKGMVPLRFGSYQIEADQYDLHRKNLDTTVSWEAIVGFAQLETADPVRDRAYFEDAEAFFQFYGFARNIRGMTITIIKG